MRAGLTLAASLLCAGCTTLFSENFERYAVGDPPTNVSRDGSSQSTYGLRTRVTGTAPLGGSRSLEMRGPAVVGSGTPAIYMQTANRTLLRRPTTFSWAGRTEGSPTAVVSVFSGHYQRMVDITVAGDRALLTYPESARPLGTFRPGRPTHAFLVTIDPVSGRYTASLVGQPAVEGTLAAADRARLAAAGPVGVIAVLTGANSAGDAYVMDDVGVAEQNPR